MEEKRKERDVMNFKKWTSIEKLSDVVVQARKQEIESISFRPKVKLHGTNAGVRICANGTVAFQKRSSDVTPTNDNQGFAAWAICKPWADTINRLFGDDKTYIVWGEWAGPGIGKGDAVCKIDRKVFFIFSVEVVHEDASCDVIVASPEAIRDIVGDVGHNVMILPWADAPVRAFMTDAGAEEFAGVVTTKLAEMEERDVYIHENFGVDHPGEGFVYYPSMVDDHDIIPRDVFGSFVFKVKTQHHTKGAKGAKGSEQVKSYVEIPASVHEFVATFVTDDRCEQIVRENFGGVYSMKNTKEFLEALFVDVEKESRNEREKGGIDMNTAKPLVNRAAVLWIKSKCGI